MSIQQPPALVQISRPRISDSERARLQRRARFLAWAGNAWHVAEFAIALAAGVAASSVALVGFALDSLIEGSPPARVACGCLHAAAASATAEQRAGRLIPASILCTRRLLAIESAYAILAGHHPEVSWVGIALAAVTAATMPLLARAKRRVGAALGSSAPPPARGRRPPLRLPSVASLAGLG